MDSSHEIVLSGSIEIGLASAFRISVETFIIVYLSLIIVLNYNIKTLNLQLNTLMNALTNIHSSLVNPAKPQTIKEMQDKQDYVSFDIPLLIRVFELVREDVKTDMDLHNLVERILALKNLGILSMDQYQQIASAHPGKDHGQTAELESIRKLAGIK